MSSSSEEDFTDEEIDLDALWRDPIVLSDDETEDKPKIEDQDGKPIVLELTPISSVIEKEELPTLPQAFINAMKAFDRERAIRYSERILAARQRIVNIGSPHAQQSPSRTPTPPSSEMTAQTHREATSLHLSQLRLRRPMRTIRRQMSGQTSDEINSNMHVIPRNNILRPQQRRTLDTITEIEKKNNRLEIDLQSLLVSDNSSNDESLTSSSSDSSLSS